MAAKTSQRVSHSYAIRHTVGYRLSGLHCDLQPSPNSLQRNPTLPTVYLQTLYAPMSDSRFLLHPTTEALANLELVPNLGRDPRLPQIYRYVGQHPKRRSQAEDATTYVYFIDPTIEGKALARELEDIMGVPYGRLETMKEKHPGESIKCMKTHLAYLTSSRPGRVEGW